MVEILFDSSVPCLVRVLSEKLGNEAVNGGVVLRDATGRLSFVANLPSPSAASHKEISDALHQALGPYARQDRVIAFNEDPGAAALIGDVTRLPIQVDGIASTLIDRRIVGSGWLEEPVSSPANPPRVVFSSLKGGVGRSTALAVAAADLARQGRNVLVVDLDLEAPGVADLLLSTDRLPLLGATDFLVENGIGGIADAALEDFIGLSALTEDTGGRVQVVPAFGSTAISNPSSVLPKLARALVDDVLANGDVLPISAQISSMIERLAAHTASDVVLIDSRAGLAELTAPAMLALGGIVLLFGTDQLQTIRGYRALFSGLNMLAQRDRSQDRKAEWRLNLKAVHAKATLDNQALARHRDNFYDLFQELYDEDRGLEGELAGDINFDIDDPDAPHWPLVIPFSQILVEFNPVETPSQLAEPFYDQIYRPFLNDLYRLIGGGSDAAARKDQSP